MSLFQRRSCHWVFSLIIQWIDNQIYSIFIYQTKQKGDIVICFSNFSQKQTSRLIYQTRRRRRRDLQSQFKFRQSSISQERFMIKNSLASQHAGNYSAISGGMSPAVAVTLGNRSAALNGVPITTTSATTTTSGRGGGGSEIAAAKRLARDYDKFSPIRQIGAQIGIDYQGGSSGIPHGPTASIGSGGGGQPSNYILGDEKGVSGSLLPQDLDIDSTDNLSTSQINHSTLSPQMLHSIREEVGGGAGQGGRARILESQPGGQSIGESLYPNLDSQKRQRFGRPFTNSPFPYMQKRSSGKTKFQQQGPLPSTAATSSNNQQLSIINEHSPIGGGANHSMIYGSAGGPSSGRVSGLKNHQKSSVLSSNDEQIVVSRYNSNQIQSLQQNLKQNIISTAGVASAGGQGIRNGGFTSNFGYQLNSESNGLSNNNFNEHPLYGVGSEESSFFQFNLNPTSLIDGSRGEDIFGNLPSNFLDAAADNDSLQRRNAITQVAAINNSRVPNQLNKGSTKNGGVHIGSSAKQTDSSGSQPLAQMVHLRRAISKEPPQASAPSKEGAKNANNQQVPNYVVGSHKGKKPRKLFTEPNSPAEHLNLQPTNLQQQSQNMDNQSQGFAGGNLKDPQMKLSGNKISLMKAAPISQSAGVGQNPYNSINNVAPYSNGGKTKGHAKKGSIDTIVPRLNHSLLEEQQPPLNKYGSSVDKNNSTFDHHNRGEFFYDDSRAGLLSEEKPQQQSFLPRLDASQRYSNSQVMYRDLDENNKSLLRERVDISMRSPTNNWINDSLHKIGHNASKKSVSSERKNPSQTNSIGASISISHTNNASVSDFNKIFKPQIKSNISSSKRQPKNNNGAASSAIAAVHLYNHQNSLDPSPQLPMNQGILLNQGGGNQFFTGGDYNQSQNLKGIGKIQPFNDMKLNEQVIRGKLANNRNTNAYMKNMNSGAMLESISHNSKVGAGSYNTVTSHPINDQQVMINVTRGSNLQLIPLTDVLSPKNLGSPLNNFSQMRLDNQNSIQSKQSSQMNQRDSSYLASQGTPMNGGDILSQQSNRLQLHSNGLGQQLHFMNSFELPNGEGDSSSQNNFYRGNGATSNLSQELQQLQMNSPPHSLISVTAGGSTLQPVFENIKSFNYRNFSVSQTSSKESNHVGAHGGGSPPHAMTPQMQQLMSLGLANQTFDDGLDPRKETVAQLVVRTQHSSGQVNLQPMNMQIENFGSSESTGGGQRHPFSPPHTLFSQHSQNSGSGQRAHYFESSNPSINFVDNGLLSPGDQSLMNGATGMGPLSLRSQHSQQIPNAAPSQQVHHTIKTVASKQIPKCFRMSKQQLQQITNKVASRGSIHNGGVIPLAPQTLIPLSSQGVGGANQLGVLESGYYTNQPQASSISLKEQQQQQQSPQHIPAKASGGVSQTIQPNDARVSFNDYAQFQNTKQPPSSPSKLQHLSALAAVQQNSGIGKYPSTTVENNIFGSGRRTSDIENEKALIEREVSERSVDDERERMTPAFNNRVRSDSIRHGQNSSANGQYTPAPMHTIFNSTLTHGIAAPGGTGATNAASQSSSAATNAMNHTLNNISAALNQSKQD